MRAYRIGDKVRTPYGPGEVIDINQGYGVRVQLKRSAEWFGFAYVSRVEDD